MSAGAKLCKGRYTLVRQLGKTGTANAWRATNNETGASVIVKVLHKHIADDVDLRERIFSHVAKLAAFDHPGFLWVLEPRIVEEKGAYAFVTEFVEGESLRDSVLDGHLSPEDALATVLQIGDALAYAHEQGVIHRDVNPSNILIDATDTPRLIEFGPPRPARADAASIEKDQLTDIYGLAMTVVFALFRNDLPMLEVVRDAAGFIDSLPCTKAIKEVLCEAANVDANERFRDARSFCEALEHAAAAGVIAQPQEQPAQQPTPSLIPVAAPEAAPDKTVSEALLVTPEQPQGRDAPLEDENPETSDSLIRSVKLMSAGVPTQEDPLDAIMASAKTPPPTSPPPPPSGTAAQPLPAPSPPVQIGPALQEAFQAKQSARVSPVPPPLEIAELTPAQPQEPKKSRGLYIFFGLALLAAIVFLIFRGLGPPNAPDPARVAGPSDPSRTQPPRVAQKNVEASVSKPVVAPPNDPGATSTGSTGGSLSETDDDGSKSSDDGPDAGEPAASESGKDTSAEASEPVENPPTPKNPPPEIKTPTPKT
ncbi:MAG: serine/threonine protein kinase, partial [Nannocystaceae bacterium]